MKHRCNPLISKALSSKLMLHHRQNKLPRSRARLFAQKERDTTDESRLYRDIVYHATTGVYVVAQASHELLYANNAMEEIFSSVGIRRYQGQKCYQLLRHRDQPCSECLACPSASLGKPREVYLEFLSKHFSVVTHAIDWHGKPAHLIYLSDISKEKIAAFEIAQIYHNIPGAVFRCKFDACWTVISANDGLFTFLGYTREEFAAMGNCMSAVVHTDDLPDILPAVEAQLAAGKVTIEHEQRLVCKDGTAKWVLVHSQLSQSAAEGDVFYCVFVDISAQKKAQFELSKTQQKLSAAIDHAGLAYWEYDIVNKRAFQNAISMREYALAQVIENYPESLYKAGVIHQSSIAQYNAIIQAVQNGEPSVKADIQTIDAQGNLSWKRIHFTTLFDDHQKPFWAVATAENLNEYKALENRFTTVLEQNHIETWLYDLSRTTIIQNHNTEAVYGIHGTEIPNAPESLIAAKQCHADDVERFRDFYKRLHQGHTQVSTTVRLWDIRTQTYIWKRCTYTVLPSRENRAIYALGSAVDVNDQMEEKQKYENAIKYRYNALGENVILAGHCNVTRNVILEIDDKTGMDVEHRFGMVREDFFRGLASLIPNQAQSQTFQQTFCNQNMKNSFELGITQHEYVCTLRLDHEKGLRWVSAHVDMVLQPKTNELIGFLTVTDISASKMQEQVLDAVIQFDYDFVAHLNLHSNTVVFYNSKKQMAQLKDYQYGVPYSYTKAIQSTARRYIASEDRALYSANMAIENIEKQLKHQDSYTFSYHLPDAAGTLYTKQIRFTMHDRSAGIVVFSRADVTHMLAQQEQQKEALTESMALARIANNAKSKFLSSMSHDIRTPMNAITGMCSLALADEGNPQQVHESLQVIAQSSALLLSMITDILDMNRIESGKMVLTNQPFSIRELLQLAVAKARALAVKKDQSVSLSCEITHARCSGDVVRIHRIMDNLLANALKFTPQGGKITYCISELPSENNKIGLYCFKVTDNGIGMSLEQQQHIFEPFYRAQSPMTSQVEGTGLGLPIVKSIVDYMGGTISVQSALGEGTSFEVELPLCLVQEGSPAPSALKDPVLSADLSHVHVLLCEDHPMNQLVATRILEKADVRVTLAENGQVAYELFSQSAPCTFDAILMDVQMPVMNGYEAACAIRACTHPQAKAIPIIAMTANAFTEDIQLSMEAGMNDH
ncbi:MAG: ATP-binding protein, partial [Clostridia bacterium]